MALGFIENYSKLPPRDPNDAERFYVSPSILADQDEQRATNPPPRQAEPAPETPNYPVIQSDDPSGIDPTLIPRAAAPDVAPVDPTAATVGADTGGTGITRPRRVATDNQSRPILNTAMTPGAIDPSTGQVRLNPSTGLPYTKLEQEQDAHDHLVGYQPQKQHGWMRYIKPLAMGSLAGARSGHPAGLLGGAIGGEIGGLVNPTAEDEQWKQNALSTVDQRIQTLNEQAKTSAQLAHLTAQTRKLNGPAPRRWQLKQNAAGEYVAVDADTGLDATGKPVRGKTPVGSSDWVLHVNEQGEYVPVNKTTGLGQDGKPVKGRSMVRQPDGTYVDATQKYTTDRQFGREDRSLDLENQKAQGENAQHQANITSARAEQDKIKQWLYGPQAIPRTLQKHDAYGNSYEAPNPIYTENETRFRHLDDVIREEQGRIKPIVKAPPRPTVTAGNSRVPAKTPRAQQLKELGIE